MQPVDRIPLLRAKTHRRRIDEWRELPEAIQRIETAIDQLNAQLHALRHPTLLPPPPINNWSNLEAHTLQLQAVSDELAVVLATTSGQVEICRNAIAVVLSRIREARGAIYADANRDDDAPPRGAA